MTMAGEGVLPPERNGDTEEELRAHQMELEIQNEELLVTQVELREALGQYRELYDRAPVGYLTLDPDGVIGRANLTVARMLGVDRGTLPGTSLASIVIAEDQDRFFLEVRRRLREENHHRAEFRMLDEAGEPFWVDLEFEVDRAGESGAGDIWCSLTDITQRKEAEEALEASLDRVRQLASRLQEVREGERKRVARELHDGIGQSLVALGMDLAWLQKEMGTQRGEASDVVEGMRVLVRELIEDVTEQMVALRPPEMDILGVSAAMERELMTLRERNELSVMEDLAFQAEDLAPEIGIQVLRIFEEAVSNILRHAAATTLSVSLREADGDLILVVEDDGRGMTAGPEPGLYSFGLIGMEERARKVGGEIGIDRSPLGGTRVRATIPLPPVPT